MKKAIRFMMVFGILLFGGVSILPKTADAYWASNSARYYSTTMSSTDTVSGSGYVKTGDSAGNSWAFVSDTDGYTSYTWPIGFKDYSYEFYYQY